MYDDLKIREKIINKIITEENKNLLYVLKIKSLSNTQIYKYFLISETIQNYEDIENAYFDGIFLDITRQKELEDELNEAKKMLNEK